jgi:hypothetical protein
MYSQLFSAEEAEEKFQIISGHKTTRLTIYLGGCGEIAYEASLAISNWVWRTARNVIGTATNLSHQRF